MNKSKNVFQTRAFFKHAKIINGNIYLFNQNKY